ncbi:hypothetical protein [Corynebacterium sp. A21]|uniref:hypothetical protein n=1 Tax=Corynebacterium sp. A21 TaxID=3457318 RepID=UPI003FD2CEC4
MTKKKNVIAMLALHPRTPKDILVPAKPRRLKAQRIPHGFELHTGALDLGFVPGDSVTIAQGIDGIRYINGIQKLRSGTLSQIDIRHSFCDYHRAETIDQLSEDLQSEGAATVAERAGLVYAFWPGSILIEDVGMAISRSAIEFDLPAVLMPTSFRHALIAHSADFRPGEEHGLGADHWNAA